MSAFSIDVSGPFGVGEFTGALGGPNQGGHVGDKWYIKCGMDLGAVHGTVVRAAFDAHITRLNPHDPSVDGARMPGEYGAQLFMRAPNDMMGAFYTHISDVPPELAIGSQVTRGDVLGTVYEFGGIPPHLHMAVVEIIGGAPNGTYVGVENLYDLLQSISDSDAVTVTFPQDGSAPFV